MADRHIIVVRVKGGEVTDVDFCSCCPGVTVQVQTYFGSDDVLDAGDALPALSRDDRGTYRTAYYESDDE